MADKYQFFPLSDVSVDLNDSLDTISSNLETLQVAINELNRVVGTLRAMRQLNGVTIQWEWSDLTDTTVDPGASMMRGNQINVNVITQFAVSNTDLFGRLLDGSELSSIQAGDFWVVADTSGTVWFYYTLDTLITPMDGGTWFQLDVTAVAGQSGNPGAGSFMENKWLPDIP